MDVLCVVHDPKGEHKSLPHTVVFIIIPFFFFNSEMKIVTREFIFKL